MPTLSMFYGIVVSMFFDDNSRHHEPHLHARYAKHKVSVSIKTGEVLAGSFPSAKLRLLQAWIEIHRDELLANWDLAKNGQELYKIIPLQ